MNIILAHGILGFHKRFGIEYFNGVAKHLEPAKVLVPEVSATGGIATRGEELRNQILASFKSGALDPAEKAHIIAHSMGGLDSRYLLSPANENTTPANDVSGRIASLTTISSPHHGSPIADLLVLEPDTGSPTLSYLRGIVNNLSMVDQVVGTLLAHFGISLDGLKDLTTESMQAFNARYGDRPGLRYYSVAGAGRPGLLPTALVFVPFHRYIRDQKNQDNDGLVTVPSAQWGDFDRNTWSCDHAEEIGHDLDHPLQTARFDYLARYDQIVKRVSA
jgi:triacylglycerol lipase